jgi:hypothetical protein
MCANDMNLYMKNPRLHQKTIRTHEHIQWNRIQNQYTKLVVFLQTNYKFPEKVWK